MLPTSYLAPSRNGDGWGVFAAKSFRKDEIVEIAPMFLRIGLEEDRVKILKETILNDYHYEYWSVNPLSGKTEQYNILSFGNTLYYNHQRPATGTNRTIPVTKGTGPNIEQQKLGKEPDCEFLDGTVAIVYFALRDIAKGEELLVDYGEGWFDERGIEEVVMNESHLNVEIKSSSLSLEQQSAMHAIMKKISCVTQHAHDRVSLERLLQSADLDAANCRKLSLESLLSLRSSAGAFFDNVRVESNMKAGETLAYAPALLLERKLLENTILFHLVFSWNDFSDSSPAFNDYKPPSKVSIQCQSDSKDGATSSKWLEVSSKETMILVLGGNISMMSRYTEDNSTGQINCELKIEEDPCNLHGYCVRVVATTDLQKGERICFGVSRKVQLNSIIEELCLTGQPVDIV